jgi:branched-chain amino acid transport system substrate-binding protein
MMKLKPTRSLLSIFVAICLVLSACGSDAEDATIESGIKIGVIQSFTGPIAAIGFKKLDGAQFYFEQVNANGGINGIPVSLVKRDSATDPAVAIQAVHDLAGDPEIVVIIGPTASGIHKATKPVTDEIGIVQIGAVSAAVLSAEAPFDWWFRAYPADVLQNRGALYFLETQGVKTIALITSDDGFGQSAADNFRAYAGDFGIEIVADEVYSPETTDPTIEIARAIQAGPDAYVIWDGTNPARVAQAVKTARLQGVVDEIIMLPEGASGEAFLEAAGDAAEGTYFFSQFAGDDPLPGAQTEFVDAFKEAFNRVPDQEILGYIEAQIVHAAIEIALASEQGLTRESVRDAMESITDLDTAIGPINYGPGKHDPQEEIDVQINQYQGGLRVRISR